MEPFEEATTVGVKVVGAVAAFFSFKWMSNIFKGEDGKFDQLEFCKFAAIIFFASTGGYMLYKEGSRVHEWNLYSEWYIAIVFGGLLTALHLDNALDKIVELAKAIVEIKRGKSNEQPK